MRNVTKNLDRRAKGKQRIGADKLLHSLGYCKISWQLCMAIINPTSQYCAVWDGLGIGSCTVLLH